MTSESRILSLNVENSNERLKTIVIINRRYLVNVVSITNLLKFSPKLIASRIVYIYYKIQL